MNRWLSQFNSASPVNGKLTGAQAKILMMESHLPNTVLAKIWVLADVDMDGLLNQQEFFIAMYLIDYKLAGNDLPSVLPKHLKPPAVDDDLETETEKMEEEENSESMECAD